ncbi:hypothetical protein [Paraburkholderia tropica]|uniref:hypothetical protein n=1 Tax=Paraburkholderia tropica TaxID=92647 RepID=UPI002AB773DB|nr:hypothetical protein [Paraburkholderia tropica]
MTASSYRTDFDRFWVLLKESRPVAFATHLARITGHPKAAVLLSQLTYWTRHGRDVARNEGWIFKTREQWWAETGLSRSEQETARERLKALGLIQEWRGGTPAKLWYRIDRDNLARALNGVREQSLPPNFSFSFMREEEAAMRRALGPTLAYHRVLAEVTGGVNAGLLLSRLVHLQRRALDAGAGVWFTVVARDWEQDLALHRRQLENAKHKLCHLGLIHETLTQTTRKRLYTQVNPARLMELLQPVIERAEARLSTRPTPGLRDRLLEAADFSAPRSGMRPTPRPGVMCAPDIAALDAPATAMAASRASGASAEAVPANVRNLPSCGRTTGFSTVWSNVRFPPTGISRSEKSVGGKRTLAEGGKQPLQSAGNGHGSWRETDMANARAKKTTGLITFPTTTAAPARPAINPAASPDARAAGGVVVCAEETTQPGSAAGLIWPSCVRRAERDAILCHLETVPVTIWQEMLDEMAANHRVTPVQSPPAYVRSMVNACMAGRFVAEKAARERERREAAQHAAAMAQSQFPAAQAAEARDQVRSRAAVDGALALLKSKGWR